MSASIFLEYDCAEISAAMSVSQYANGQAEISSTCWLKLTAKWPELEDRLIYNLDEAEKAFRAKQRSLRLDGPQPEAQAA